MLVLIVFLEKVIYWIPVRHEIFTFVTSKFILSPTLFLPASALLTHTLRSHYNF